MGGCVLKQGLYEEIINREIKQELLALDEATYAIEKKNLDAEEARKFLAAYISNVTRKALEYVRGEERDDKEALWKQIAACNRVIAMLSHELDDEAFGRLEIDEAGEVLQAVHSKLNDVRSIQKEKTIRQYKIQPPQLDETL